MIIKIIICTAMFLLGLYSFEQYNDNYKIEIAGHKTKNKIYGLLECRTMKAKYYRSTLAWNEATTTGSKWPDGLQQQVLTSAYIEMKDLYKIAPGYKDVTKFYNAMEKARYYVQDR